MNFNNSRGFYPKNNYGENFMTNNNADGGNSGRANNGGVISGNMSVMDDYEML